MVCLSGPDPDVLRVLNSLRAEMLKPFKVRNYRKELRAAVTCANICLNYKKYSQGLQTCEISPAKMAGHLVEGVECALELGVVKGSWVAGRTSRVVGIEEVHNCDTESDGLLLDLGSIFFTRFECGFTSSPLISSVFFRCVL
jgi:hypothetical protein